MVFLWQLSKDCDKMDEVIFHQGNREAPKNGITSLPPHALAARMAALGQKPFRAGQIFGWLHGKRVADFEEMTNLPVKLRETLAEEWVIERPEVLRVQRSADGTAKYLLGLADGNCVEAVRMVYNHGNSLCISSQVGCRMGCRFCASTKNGLVRNLTAGEMAGEVYAVMAESGQQVNSVVLMGIGEPLDNFDAVMDFISIITDPGGLNLSGRAISLSTCGLVPGIRQLAERKLPLTLSISLHAADDETRGGMMPVNSRWPIAELMEACRDYRAATGRRISYEYALVHGVNDRPKDAAGLAALLRGTDGHVNLIPLSETDGNYRKSTGQAVRDFQQSLLDAGVNATVRRTLGADISAACGQLRTEHTQRK